VLDASAAAEIVVRSTLGRRLLALAPRDRTWWVPDHFHVQTAGAVRRMLLRGIVDESRATAALVRLHRLPVMVARSEPLIDEAWSYRSNLIMQDAEHRTPFTSCSPAISARPSSLATARWPARRTCRPRCSTSRRTKPTAPSHERQFGGVSRFADAVQTARTSASGSAACSSSQQTAASHAADACAAMSCAPSSRPAALWGFETRDVVTPLPELHVPLDLVRREGFSVAGLKGLVRPRGTRCDAGWGADRSFECRGVQHAASRMARTAVLTFDLGHHATGTTVAAAPRRLGARCQVRSLCGRLVHWRHRSATRSSAMNRWDRASTPR
jgi:predicted nucleic acid-binding protein